MVHYPQIHREFKGHLFTESNDVRLEGLLQQCAAFCFFCFFSWVVLWIGCNIIRLCFVSQLPPGARVSKDCRDLLLRLLERNPDARITFAEFFAHPFVDLEHMPSADSIVKAVRGWLVLLTYLHHTCSRGVSQSLMLLLSFVLLKKELVLQAVQKDQEGERSAALSFYCSALEYFVPAIYCKSNNYPHILSMPLNDPLTLPRNKSKFADCKTKIFPFPPQTRRTDNVKMPSGRRWAWKHGFYLHLDYFSFSFVYFSALYCFSFGSNWPFMDSALEKRR